MGHYVSIISFKIYYVAFFVLLFRYAYLYSHASQHFCNSIHRIQSHYFLIDLKNVLSEAASVCNHLNVNISKPHHSFVNYLTSNTTFIIIYYILLLSAMKINITFVSIFSIK